MSTDMWSGVQGTDRYVLFLPATEWRTLSISQGQKRGFMHKHEVRFTSTLPECEYHRLP